MTQPIDQQQAATNELAAWCEARGWLTPRDQMVHLFSHHQCDMVTEENGLLWNKICSCGATVDARLGGYTLHLIEVLKKESGHEAVSFDVRGQVQARLRSPDHQGSDDCSREDRSLCQEAFSRNDRESGDDTFALQRLDQDTCTYPRLRRRGLYYKLRKALTDFICGLVWTFGTSN
jgi:hypothetical protein